MKGPWPSWAEREQADNTRLAPPVDMPPDFAVIRSDGAIRAWDGALWRWSTGNRSWRLLDHLTESVAS